VKDVINVPQPMLNIDCNSTAAAPPNEEVLLNNSAVDNVPSCDVCNPPNEEGSQPPKTQPITAENLDELVHQIGHVMMEDQEGQQPNSATTPTFPSHQRSALRLQKRMRTHVSCL